MKELKDYIHLYVGCRVQWTRSDGNIVKQELTLSDASWLRERADAKLILRPLESMIEEECNEWNRLNDTLYTMADGANQVMQNAAAVAWVLSKGFDLFGLKEAGLAVYE